MHDQTFRTRLADAERPLIGLWLCSGSTLVAEIVAGAEPDWLLIDMEHAPNTLDRVLAQLQTVAAFAAVPLVRVPSSDPVAIKQVLDLGAQNIIVPMISSVTQARSAVTAVRYPPQGVRGVGSALARSGRWNRTSDYLQTAAGRVSLTVQIEDLDAVDAAHEIAGVPGVDAVLIGPSDLAASMGLIGQPRHPDVVDAVRRTISAVRETGTPVGFATFDPAVAEEYFAAGAQFAVLGADVTFLARGADDVVARWRATPRTERTLR